MPQTKKTQNKDNQASPTMEPRKGLNSSDAAISFAVKIGQVVAHRGSTEFLLDHMPSVLSGPIRALAIKQSKFLSRAMLSETELQEAMNGKTFMNTVDPTTGQEMLSEAPEGYLKSLFPQGKQDEWPQQVVLCGKDIRPDPLYLRKVMLHLPNIVSDVIDQQVEVPHQFDADTAGKTVVLGVFDTKRNLIDAAAGIQERMEIIKNDPLSIKGINLAAETIGKELLEAATLREEQGLTILRDDAPEIFRHVMTHGFSQGGNIASDAFRFIRHELMEGKYELALDAKGRETIGANNDAVVSQIIGGATVFIYGAADVAYTAEELATLPARDHVRSDGDLVISLATGTPKQQSNFNPTWHQDEPATERNDRLIVSVGPKKRGIGLFDKANSDYHSNAGHTEDSYRDSSVKFGKETLRERWLPRFTDTPVANDITFASGIIHLNFERGSKPEAIEEATQKFADYVGKHADISVESELFPSNPYHLQLRAQPTPENLKSIRDGLAASGIETAQEVGTVLDIDSTVDWLKDRLQKLPNAQIEIETKENGPFLHIAPSDDLHAGGHLHLLLSKGLERIGISTQDRRTINGEAVEIPLHDVVDAIKAQNREQSTGRGR